MKRFIIFSILLVAILGVVIMKNSAGVSDIIYNLSKEGSWLLPLVFFSSLLDSVHPCSFSILLITIAFLFGMQMTRTKILKIGGTMKITLETNYEDGDRVSTSIEVNDNGIKAYDALVRLVIPILYAFGYHPESVHDAVIEYAQELEDDITESEKEE